MRTELDRRSRGYRRASLAAAFVIAGSMVAACGSGGASSKAQSTIASSTGSDQAGLAAAQSNVRTATAVNTGFTSPGASFDSSKLRGKKIWVITFLSVPFAQQSVQGLKEAAAAVGATVTAVDGSAGVDAYQRGIKQAIAQKADAIIIGTLNPSLFRADLAVAHAKGIKVIAVSSQAPGTSPAAGDPVDGFVDPCYKCAGGLMADSAITDSKGKADVLVLWSSDVKIPGEAQLSAIQAEFGTNCPGCRVKVQDVPAAQWATRLQPVTQSAVSSDPKLDYILPLYDGMVTFMVPGIRAANAQTRVKISSFNATPAVMQQIGSGGVVLSDVGIGSVRYGWGWADQTFRVLSGVPAVTDEKLPVRLFDASNVGSINLTASTDPWYGSVDYRSEYKKLWGLTS